MILLRAADVPPDLVEYFEPVAQRAGSILHVNPEPQSLQTPEGVQHFAAFPTALIRPWILAGSARQACPSCGKAWERAVERPPNKSGLCGGEHREVNRAGGLVPRRPRDRAAEAKIGQGIVTLGVRPACACPDNTGSARSLVLDPFAGTGTTLRVAEEEGRDWLGIDISESYMGLQAQRLANTQRRLAL